MKALFLCRSGREVLAVLFLFAVLGVSPVNGQGVQVIFGNRSLNNPCGPVDAPIYGLQGWCVGDMLVGNGTNKGGNVVYLGPLLAGTGYTAALFAGPEGSSEGGLAEIGRTSGFRTGNAAGYFFTTELTVPWLVPGTRPVFQVRAWDNRGGTLTSWHQVFASGGSIASGSSALFSPQCPPLLPGQTPQIYLTGLTSFNLWLPTAVPFWVRSLTTNVVAMPGGTATLAADVYRCTLNGGVSVTQQWWRADSPIPGATNSMLVLTNVSSPDAGDYVFVIGPGFFSPPLRYTMRLFVPPRLSAIQFSPPRTATLTYDTGRELKVTIEAATSLSNWVTLHTGPATGQFQDNDATNQFRHYRLRLEP